MAIIENINVSSPNDGLGDSLRDSQIKANSNFAELNDKKVEKVAGKDLSANDFTDILKTKLDGIEDGADVQIQSDWNQTDNSAKDFIKNKPDLSQYFSAVGYFDYNDLATATTPLNYTTGLLQLTNDTLGTFTNTNFPPYGVTNVWDSTTNTFNFSELSIGDEVILRVHISITTSGANQISGLRLLFGEGTANEFTLPIDINIEHRTAGLHDIVKEISFYIGNEDWRITPVKLQFNSSASATVKVFGWHPYIIRRSINILDVNDDNYKTFTIINIEADNDDTTVTEGGVSIGYNSLTNKINSILFDIPFSSYIYNYDQLSGIYDFSVNFVDKSNGKSFTSFITGFNTFGSHYKLDLQETLDYAEYSITDKIELFIQAQIHNPSIDDTAGDGVLNKSWSANKLFDEFALKESLANKGVANGYVPLNGSTLIDSIYLPSYVDDVIEVADFSSLPITGETGKIYVTLDNGKLYRWTGTVYVEISQGVTAHSQLTLDDGTNPHGTTKTDVGLGNVLNLEQWTTTGNAGTNATTNFVGTTDNIDFVIRRNNSERLKIENNLTTALGTYSALKYFKINGSLNVESFDLTLGAGDNSRGVTGASRALVKDLTSILSINYQNDFTNGTFIYGNLGIGNTTPGSAFTPTAKLDVNGSTRLRGTLLDVNNQAGTSGQILSSTGTGIDWIDSSSILGTTNLSYTASPTNGIVVSDTGTDATIPLATGTNAGLLSPSQFTTLNNGVWSLLGNAGTNPATNFIGTTDEVGLLIKTNNITRIHAAPTTGNVTIGGTGGTTTLQVSGTFRTTQRALIENSAGDTTTLANSVTNQTLQLYPLTGDARLFFGGAGVNLTIQATNSVGTANDRHILIQPFAGFIGVRCTGANLPTKTLDINGELRIRTLPTGLSTENILVVNANGDVRSISPNSRFIDKQIPTGLINGTNTIFTLTNTPVSGSEHVYRNGLLQESGVGNDYTISGATITFVTAPLTGDKIVVTYRI